MRQTFFLSFLFVALVLGINNAVADEPSPWSIHGTVRDTEGKPMSEVWIHIGINPMNHYAKASAKTDAKGNYQLPITAQVLFGKTVGDTPDQPDKGFHFQQFILYTSDSLYDIVAYFGNGYNAHINAGNAKTQRSGATGLVLPVLRAIRSLRYAAFPAFIDVRRLSFSGIMSSNDSTHRNLVR